MNHKRVGQQIVVALAGVGLVTAAAACSDSSDSSSTSSPASPSSSASSVADICDLVTDQQIQDAVGAKPDTSKPGEEMTAGESVCYWKTGSKYLLTLTRYAAPLDVTAKMAELKSGLFYDESLPSPGVGDESFYRLAGHNDAAVVVFRKGDVAYMLEMGNTADAQVSEAQEAAARPHAVELAQDVLAH